MRADGNFILPGHSHFEECAWKRLELRHDEPTQVHLLPGSANTLPQVHDRTLGGERAAPLAPRQMCSERAERERAQRARSCREAQAAPRASAWGGADDMGGKHASMDEDVAGFPPPEAVQQPFREQVGTEPPVTTTGCAPGVKRLSHTSTANQPKAPRMAVAPEAFFAVPPRAAESGPQAVAAVPPDDSVSKTEHR